MASSDNVVKRAVAEELKTLEEAFSILVPKNKFPDTQSQIQIMVSHNLNPNGSILR